MRTINHILILGLVGLSAFLLFGCTGCGFTPPSTMGNLENTSGSTSAGSNTYKGIKVPAGAIPEKCYGMEDCQMFACMVSQCWCKDNLEGGILSSGTSGTKVETADAAVTIVKNFLKSRSIAYKETSLRAVKLNGVFYNVFYETPDGIELTLTVGLDGTILETVCGV